MNCEKNYVVLNFLVVKQFDSTLSVIKLAIQYLHYFHLMIYILFFMQREISKRAIQEEYDIKDLL